VDNPRVREAQIAKLERLKAGRDATAVEAALDALTQGARGNANLLELSVRAARAKATVGEISAAMEKAFGRHRAEIRAISGVYGSEVGAMSEEIRRVIGMAAAFERDAGRRPRILVAKIGQDGHDRGQKVIATAFADLGFDVDIGPLFATPDEVARMAVENDVHIIGVSTLAAGHLTLVPELKAALGHEGRGDIMIVVGGVIPPEDHRIADRSSVSRPSVSKKLAGPLRRRVLRHSFGGGLLRGRVRLRNRLGFLWRGRFVGFFGRSLLGSAGASARSRRGLRRLRRVGGGAGNLFCKRTVYSRCALGQEGAPVEGQPP
jgi:methylmalonyl-CoA mutase cobalamin-binding domain/chain